MNPNQVTFSDLGVIEPILRALAAEGYANPTPIQAQSIPPLIAGRDLLGIAQTGTGKTCAFAVPILQRLVANRVRPAARGARALILAPTRELAAQINDSFRAYGRHLGLKSAVIFGGVGQKPQVDALMRGLDILIATPGRLLDLMEQGHARLAGTEILVLDEADRMFDMGFIRDVRKIVAAVPKQRQTLCFSATMPADVAGLVRDILADPVKVEIAPPASTVERIEQRVYHVDGGNKRALLGEVLKEKSLARVIVFTRTKHGANKVAEHLSKTGVVAEAIHGNKSQSARQRALDNFRRGHARVLVATDIAARGIDVDGITHVVNFELPEVPESYVHRIGRTARAGNDGMALTFCGHDERGLLRDIERTIGRQLTVVEDHPFHAPPAPGAMNTRPQRQQNHQHRGHGGGRRHNGHQGGGHRQGGHGQGHGQGGHGQNHGGGQRSQGRNRGQGSGQR